MDALRFFQNCIVLTLGRLRRQLWLLAGLVLLSLALTLGAGRAARQLLSRGVDFSGVTLALAAPAGDDTPALLERYMGLRGIVTMGSPLEREACIRFQKLLTPNIFNGYGTTETFWNSFLRPTDLPELAGSAGRSCIDDEVRVVRVYDDGRRAGPEDTVPADGESVGEIIISSWAKSSMGYLDNPELTRERFHRGWFYTRDLGTWDARHNITVLGRRDDMIICMGENIYPAQVEEVICRHEKVRDCAVTGVPDPARGQAVAAYVVPADDSLTIQELARHCAASCDLADYKCPRWYCLTDEIPYNATGKKRHFALRGRAPEDLQNGRLKRP